MIDTKAIRAAAEAAPKSQFRVCHNFGPFYSLIGDGDYFHGRVRGKERADFIATANPAAILELLDRLEAAEAEVLEQARMLGIGGEKELALMARLDAAETQLTIYEKHGVTCQTFEHKLTGCAECNRDDAMESVNETNAALANSYLELLPKLEAAEKDAARIRNEALEEAINACKEYAAIPEVDLGIPLAIANRIGLLK